MKKKIILFLLLSIILIAEVYYLFAKGDFKITNNSIEFFQGSITSRDEENKISGLTSLNESKTDPKTGVTSISVEEGSLFIEPIELTLHDRKVYFVNKSDNRTISIPINKPTNSQITPAISNPYIKYPFVFFAFIDFINTNKTDYTILVYNLTSQKETFLDVVTCKGAFITDVAYNDGILYWSQYKTWSDSCSGNFKKKVNLD
ncbi:MAG: hypothetical protein WC863_00815 [Patescibacteria group bacterium]